MGRGSGATKTANPTGRRGFFQALASVGTGTAAGLAGLKLLEPGEVEAAEIPPVRADSGGSVIRMQQELEQTLANNRTPSWLMVVDTRKCIGCDACSVACKAENPTGPGANFRRVIKKELPIGPRPWAIYKPVNCLQCDDAPCAKAVPQGMVTKRADGIVEFDSTRLRGAFAQAAAKACPLKQMHIDDGKTYTQSTPKQQDYEGRTFVENGVVRTRKGVDNLLADSARKCTFCSHLLEVGVLPACVTTCVGGAMYFGDGNNSSSLVNEITQGRRVFKGHQNLGLKPRVIYFEESMPDAPHVVCAACHS
ncbi:MAG: 4Fe-4S dicluster domain-containing protein [Acidobacteria bacterium]|nr:4Fe-4S dicluster domain-containing protein [Acidobacteriota bacterium]